MQIKSYIVILALVFLSFQLTGQERHAKRGLGYGSHSTADLQAISQGITWWYNWWHQPENSSVMAVYRDYDMEFVPMAWNTGFNKTAMRAYLLNHPDVDYILGFNEPNFLEQANLTPSQAAAAWPLIEELADEFDLKIVGPALNYSWVGGAPSEMIDGELVHYNDPFVWLDAFFEAYPDCRVDYLAVHAYMNHVGALEWFIDGFKKYNKPIWLTEFCAWEGEVSVAAQKNFMKSALAYLDNDPDVFRYAWFSGRTSTNPYYGLYGKSGELTELGKIYVGLPETIKNGVTLRVVDKTKGVVTNNAVWPDQAVYTWLGNTSNWAAISNAGAWWAGMYNGLAGGNLEKTEDAWTWSFTFEPEFGRTYQWNPGVFTDVSRTEQSLKALHVNRNLSFSVNSSGMLSGEVTLVIENATTATVTPENYSVITGLAPKPEDRSSAITIYPNPVRDVVHVESPWNIESLTVYDYSGRMVFTGKGINQADLGALAAGSYILQIVTETDGFAMKKISVIR
jgi:hypothetical protein